MRHMKLPLAKGVSLLGGEVGRVRAGLIGMMRLGVLGQSLDLRQVFQLERVIVGGKSDVFIFEASVWFLGDLTLGSPEVFVVRLSKKGSLIEDLECGCLSSTTIVESLEPSVWAV